MPSRTDRDKSKILVPKDLGKIRQDHDAGGKSQTIGDQTKQAYHSNFPRISSNFDKMSPKSNTPQERIDQQMVNPPTYGQKEQVSKPAPYTVVQTYADRLRIIKPRVRFLLS